MAPIALHFALLGLGASLVNAIPPNANNYLIPHPPATVTVTVTACGSQCASTVTFTETLTVTPPYMHTCEPSTTSIPGSLSSTFLSSSILPPTATSPGYTNSSTSVGSSTSSEVTGAVSSWTPTTRVTVSSQLPSAGTPSSSLTWTVNATSHGTGTAGTSVTTGSSSSLWTNSTRTHVTRTVTKTIRTTDTGSSTSSKVSTQSIPSIPTISIPPLPSFSTRSESSIAPPISYSLTTLTTTSVFNTTVSSQHPGASTHSLSTSYTTKRTTVVVTLTKTVPLSTGTAYSSTIRGTATLSSVSGGYDYPPSTKESAVSPGTTVGSAKPTLVSSSTSDIPGGYDTQYPAPTSSLGITVSSALPTLISPTASSIPGGYDYPPSPSSKASEETTSTEYLGTTVASARPSLVSPSVSEVSPTPTTFETRKSDEYTSASTIYGGYEFGRRRALRM
ncbi:hypothetical protein COL516b_011262 [Colletotrichum fioriniae]|nr:uncharacterized protein COL516b_011262 [Colletotrichum fioriniae]KAJ0296876.1 hypothetical protein COL516b_011262 [Colletotrichum fioriniae]